MNIEKFASIIAAATAREVIKYAGPAGAVPTAAPQQSGAAQTFTAYAQSVDRVLGEIVDKIDRPVGEFRKVGSQTSMKTLGDFIKGVQQAAQSGDAAAKQVPCDAAKIRTELAAWNKAYDSLAANGSLGQRVENKSAQEITAIVEKLIAFCAKTAAQVEQMAKKAAKRAYDTIKNKYASEVPAFARPDFVKASSKKSISNLMKVAKKFK